MSQPPLDPPAPTSVRTFVFAGGGTGGHLYPALAIAERLCEADPDLQCIFLCSPRPIDAKILAEERVNFTVIPAAPLGLHPARLIRFIKSWHHAVAASRAALSGLQGRGAVQVVAMGGFVAAPVVRAAWSLGVEIDLVNLDAVPGKANRWIARSATQILDAAGSGYWPNARVLRPIVRSKAIAPLPPEQCRASLGLSPESRTLFVTGGSQGARTINELMIGLIRTNPGLLQDWQVFHQTGLDADALMQRVYDEAGIPARTVPFCTSIGLAWGAATLAIARSGAGTVGEVWANGVPTVFLPYPFHRDQHQVHNAAPLVKAGGAIVCRDWIDPDQNARSAAPIVASLIRDTARLCTMRDALRGLGPADGASAAAAALMGRST